jgi:predicted nucleic acid-binding protein
VKQEGFPDGWGPKKEWKSSVHECRDPKDDRYPAIAAAAKADLIVSGDVHDLLSMHPWRGISILSLANFLALPA